MSTSAFLDQVYHMVTPVECCIAWKFFRRLSDEDVNPVQREAARDALAQVISFSKDTGCRGGDAPPFASLLQCFQEVKWLPPLCAHPRSGVFSVTENERHPLVMGIDGDTSSIKEGDPKLIVHYYLRNHREESLNAFFNDLVVPLHSWCPAEELLEALMQVAFLSEGEDKRVCLRVTSLCLRWCSAFPGDWSLPMRQKFLSLVQKSDLKRLSIARRLDALSPTHRFVNMKRVCRLIKLSARFRKTSLFASVGRHIVDRILSLVSFSFGRLKTDWNLCTRFSRSNNGAYSLDSLRSVPASVIAHALHQALAYQFASIDARREMVNCRWTKTKRLTRGVLASVATFNIVVQWVTSEVLKQEETTARVQVLEKIISIGTILRDLQNFMGVQMIVCGLSSTCIRRLKNTYRLLSPDSARNLEEMRALMSRDRGFANYRIAVRKSTPNSIPYLGMYLTDLTFIDEGSVASNPGILKIHRLKMFSKVLTEVIQHQKASEHVFPSEWSLFFLSMDASMFWNEEDAYLRSLALEPRQSKNPV